MEHQTPGRTIFVRDRRRVSFDSIKFANATPMFTNGMLRMVSQYVAIESTSSELLLLLFCSLIFPLLLLLCVRGASALQLNRDISATCSHAVL